MVFGDVIKCNAAEDSWAAKACIMLCIEAYNAGARKRSCSLTQAYCSGSSIVYFCLAPKGFGGIRLNM